MSDTTHTDDSMAAYLRDRIAQLDAEIAERKAQRGEVEQTLAVWTDGRSRVSRQRKARTAGNSTAPTVDSASERAEYGDPKRLPPWMAGEGT